MKARLQFALSLAFDFDVYISDEITAVGDAEFKKKAQKAFADLTGKSSLIMVSHGEGTLRQFCRSEERRVGKECVSTCRSRWSPYQSNTTTEDIKRQNRYI